LQSDTTPQFPRGVHRVAQRE